MTYTDSYTVVDHLLEACDDEEQFIRLSEIFAFRSPSTINYHVGLDLIKSQVAVTDRDYQVLTEVFG